MRYLSCIVALLFLCTCSAYAQDKKTATPAAPDYSILVNDHSKDGQMDVFIYVPATKFVYRNENKNAFKGIEVGYLFGDKQVYISVTATNSLVFFANGEDQEITTIIMSENGTLRVLLPKGKTFDILYR